MSIAILQMSVNHDLSKPYDGYIIDNIDKVNQESLIGLLKQEVVLGKPVLGIGEQATRLLIDSGLIPGLEKDQAAIKLGPGNQTYRTLLPALEFQYNAFTRFIQLNTCLKIADVVIQQQFIIPRALLLEMQINGLDVLHYVDEAGKRLDSIAAVANKTGNVMAILPRLELTSLDILIESMREFILKGYKQIVKPLCYARARHCEEAKRFDDATRSIFTQLCGLIRQRASLPRNDGGE